MKNNITIKKQIIYRSTHRGTKEMDLLLGNFVKKNINFLNDAELDDLDKLLKMEDKILEEWYFDKINFNPLPHNKVTKLLKKFKI